MVLSFVRLSFPVQELEDRQRLEHLLALTQPINQEVGPALHCDGAEASKIGARPNPVTRERALTMCSVVAAASLVCLRARLPP